MAQREWVDAGDGRQVYRVVRVEETDADRERARQAVGDWLARNVQTEPVIPPMIGNPDQHPAGPELTDRTPATATTITITGDEVPAPDDDTPNGRLRRFMYLAGRKKALKAELAAVEAEARILNGRILDDWSDDGVSRVTVDGTTAYLYPVSHLEKVGDTTPADIRDALTRSGLGYMLEPTYSASALQAFVKEVLGSGRELPAPLAEVVTLVINHEVRLRAATASTRRAQG